MNLARRYSSGYKKPLSTASVLALSALGLASISLPLGYCYKKGMIKLPSKEQIMPNSIINIHKIHLVPFDKAIKLFSVSEATQVEEKKEIQENKPLVELEPEQPDVIPVTFIPPPPQKERKQPTHTIKPTDQKVNLSLDTQKIIEKNMLNTLKDVPVNGLLKKIVYITN